MQDDKGVPISRLPYVLRVVVPCYKEPLDVVKATVQAAYDAPLPHGCTKYVYLCDDGKDPEKKALMHSYKVCGGRGVMVWMCVRVCVRGCV